MAESESPVVFDGTCYFPAQSVVPDRVIKTERVFHCPKRGYGVYVDVRARGKEKKDAAVYFAHPYPEASAITGYFCFLFGVEIVP